MGVDIYYFYHGFGLKAFEGHHIRIYYNCLVILLLIRRNTNNPKKFRISNKYTLYHNYLWFSSDPGN